MIHKFFLSPEMKEKLELTDEQTEKLETLMTTHAKEAVDIKGQIQKLKIDKKQLMKNTKMDISAIESKMKQLYDLKLKYKIHRLKGFQQAREILTDKQRTVVEEIWNKYQGKGKRMMKQGCAQCTHHQMPEKEKK